MSPRVEDRGRDPDLDLDLEPLGSTVLFSVLFDEREERESSCDGLGLGLDGGSGACSGYFFPNEALNASVMSLNLSFN